MQTRSRDGKFILRVSDDVPTGREYRQRGDVADVYIEGTEGMDITLADLANTIRDDCFCWDNCGLMLNVKKIRCNLTVGERTYKFTVKHQSNDGRYLSIIAKQFKL